MVTRAVWSEFPRSLAQRLPHHSDRPTVLSVREGAENAAGAGVGAGTLYWQGLPEGAEAVCTLPVWVGLQPDRTLLHALLGLVSVGQDSGARGARPTTLPEELD